jgi:hypothetical protein
VNFKVSTVQKVVSQKEYGGNWLSMTDFSAGKISHREWLEEVPFWGRKILEIGF